MDKSKISDGGDKTKLNKSVVLNMKARNRATKWAIDNMDNKQLIDSLNNGIYGLRRDFGFLRNFRDGDVVKLKKEEERLNSGQEPKPFFYHRRLEKNKDRAKRVEKEMKELYLRKGKPKNLEIIINHF